MENISLNAGILLILESELLGEPLTGTATREGTKTSPTAVPERVRSWGHIPGQGQAAGQG